MSFVIRVDSGHIYPDLADFWGIAVLSFTAVVVNMSRPGWALLFSIGPDTFGVIWQVKLKRVQP